MNAEVNEREDARRAELEEIRTKNRQRQTELEKRENSLELQSEKQSRRALRTEIQQTAKSLYQEPELSDQAKESFQRVTRACAWTLVLGTVLLIASLVGPLLALGYEGLADSPDVLPLAWSMRILFGFTVATTLVYYIRLLSSWSDQVTATELESKQFALDFDRASWLVEMSLEYEKEGKEIPQELVRSFSRGLFGAAPAQREETPSQSLLSLFRNAESLRVGGAGAEIEIGGKQVQRADAEARKAKEG